MRPVTILYEDSRGPAAGFGLHKLVVALVFDEIDGERHRVERALDGRPMKGNSRVLGTVRNDLPQLSRDGRMVVAVLDDDRVRDLLGLEANASDDRVIEAVKEGCELPERLVVVLLRENAETVVRAAGECDPSVDREALRRAVERKDLAARDIILGDAAKAVKRAVRDCILREVGSLGLLVETLSALVRGEEGEQPSHAGTPGR